MVALGAMSTPVRKSPARAISGPRTGTRQRLKAFDNEPFILALFEPATYEVLFPDCDITLGDLNGDGEVDAFDIEPFLDVLFGG